jgi:aldehyde dehydrogenase (NAD+)
MKYIDLGQKQGARLASGGNRAREPGYFVEPTVFADVEDRMAVCTDEIFGPVVVVQRFKDLSEVITRGNDTRFGLAAAVWTNDIGKAHTIADNLRAGTVWVNCYNVIDCAAPFGGFKQSGIGRELGEKALDNYTEIKTVTIRKRGG